MTRPLREAPLEVQAIFAAGGFAPPSPLPYHTAWDLDRAHLVHEVLPQFKALNSWTHHWFRDAAEAWAFNRELELRNERKAHEAEHELALVEWPFELRQREDEW